MNDRERSWRAVGERARLAVVPKPSADVIAIREAAARFAAAAAEAESRVRAIKLRDVARKLRELDHVVETECRCDGFKLRMLATHFDYIAGNLDPKQR